MEQHCRALTEHPYNVSSPVCTNKWRGHKRADEVAAAIAATGEAVTALGYGVCETGAFHA